MSSAETPDDREPPTNKSWSRLALLCVVVVLVIGYGELVGRIDFFR